MKNNNELIPSELSQEELLEYLKVNADQVEDGHYFRKFTEEELSAAREKFADESIIFNRDNELVREEIKSLKASLKPREIMLKELLDSISLGGRNENGKTYVFKDYNERKAYKYNEVGECVSQRKLLPEEKQITLQKVN